MRKPGIRKKAILATGITPAKGSIRVTKRKCVEAIR